jgi:hypothetical protein
MPVIVVALIVYVGLSLLVVPFAIAAIIAGSRTDTELLLGETLGQRARVPPADPQRVASGQGITSAPTA